MRVLVQLRPQALDLLLLACHLRLQGCHLLAQAHHLLFQRPEIRLHFGWQALTNMLGQGRHRWLVAHTLQSTPFHALVYRALHGA